MQRSWFGLLTVIAGTALMPINYMIGFLVYMSGFWITMTWKPKK